MPSDLIDVEDILPELGFEQGSELKRNDEKYARPDPATPVGRAMDPFWRAVGEAMPGCWLHDWSRFVDVIAPGEYRVARQYRVCRRCNRKNIIEFAKPEEPPCE